MIEIIKNSYEDFKASYKKYLSFELIYMLLASFIFVPLISLIFNRMLKIMGTGTLLNADVYKIASSYTGIIGMLLISFLAVVILYIEFGVMIIIAQKRYFDRNILVSEALVTTIRKLPKLLGFGFLQLIPILLLITPFIDSSTLPVLLDFNIPIFLTSEVYQSYFSIIIYLFVFLIIVYLFIKWIFTLHYIFIEEKSVWDAMKLSMRITRDNKLKILLSLSLLNVSIFVAGFLVMTMISQVATMLDTKVIGDIISNYLITFSSYITIIFSLLLLPINIIIITRLFYRFNTNQGDSVDDQLLLETSKKLNEFEHYVTRFFTKRKKALTTIVVLFLTGMFLINYTVNETIVYLKWDVSVASHRGDLKSAPENSMSSIRSAIDKGVDAIEVDVQITKDGVIVLNHDYDLERIAGVSSTVKDMTYEEVSKIDIGRLYSEDFIGEKIPTLDEVLGNLKQEETKLIIDVKTAESSVELAEGVVELIEKHDMEDVSYIQAFDNELLQEIRNRNSEIKIGQILYLAVGNLSSLDVDFYTIRQSMLTERFIENARENNREVWVWTVNSKRNMKEVLKYDIDGIITDYPEKVQNVLGVNFSQQSQSDN
ncbi:glycerophosphoryl diester phosphodiesterase membrane domain-containing protein [Aquibacillus saliphilus]|uniref:glycerophosphoryl diester phosphodiesterase membrane domain-containing protein n=1 Tax=Aquibacillus saliphilus TaxID=1909422 RepID=UPI001CF026D6|nr:glycerophosphoryl diester phosphodiesterase membrane domain-containing protein [Aquibacillus saliphilus]